MPGAGLDALVGGKTSSFKFLRLIMGDGKQWPIKKHFFLFMGLSFNPQSKKNYN